MNSRRIALTLMGIALFLSMLLIDIMLRLMIGTAELVARMLSGSRP